MSFLYRRIETEISNPCYDGRNGFPTSIKMVFQIVETDTCFGNKVEQVIATTTEEFLAKRIIEALQRPLCQTTCQPRQV